MSVAAHAALHQFLNDYAEHPEARGLREELIRLTESVPDAHVVDGLIQLYKDALPLIETTLDTLDFDDAAVQHYQRVYRELEALIGSTDHDDRHSFVIIIPVADRPLHLKACLNSLLELCRAFGFGGQADGRYRKVLVIIADDSKDATNIGKHREIADHFDRLGLATLYFGLDEQLAQLDRLSTTLRDRLARVVGSADRTVFYHKGPSILRNIVYLKLNELSADGSKRLFYFMDSDQEFRVKICRQGGDKDIYLINYFYQLDRIFSATDIRVLTGKVVGDPPVSPAVMAGTFLDDVMGFLAQIGTAQHHTACRFHGQPPRIDSGASYHDMAGLFGFNNPKRPYDYRCTLVGEHDHAHCLADFANKLNGFFDGVHPTRITYFDARDNPADIRPARTVYTGNYVLRPDALRYFIPFATLRLRMAGPALGRIIQAEIGHGFVSANLPLLHKRTVGETGQSEYRPGVEKAAQRVDLSGEFERQFFGDVLLFTLEKLVAAGYPHTDIPVNRIEQILTETAADLHRQYLAKQIEIMHKLSSLKHTINDTHWWQHFPDSKPVRETFQVFLENMTYNFGQKSPGYQRIGSPDNQASHRQKILDAILQYANDRIAWDAALAKTQMA